jgi:hypothetical protein
MARLDPQGPAGAGRVQQRRACARPAVSGPRPQAEPDRRACSRSPRTTARISMPACGWYATPARRGASRCRSGSCC